MAAMDLHTLLTRQMELHTSMRHPPMTKEQLVQLRTTMRRYSDLFAALHTLARELAGDPVTIFQCLMQLGIGGVVSFDRQHQDGAVPMHQAKVLARADAVALEPVLRRHVSPSLLASYVDLTKDLRTRLRVKVEDGNDLRAVEKTVHDALEYLDFIHDRAGGVAERMFAFYMVEDAAALRRLLHAPTFDTDGLDGDDGDRNAMEQSDAAPPVSRQEWLAAVGRYGTVMAEGRRPAAERLRAARTLLGWFATTKSLRGVVVDVVIAMEAAVGAMIAEKRSALCRTGCDLVVALLHRLDDATDHPRRVVEAVSATLAVWARGLTRGVIVTVAAIAAATDRALRELVLCARGDVGVAKAIVAALESGSHAELRRRCLGYLALGLAAGGSHEAKSLGALLDGVAVRYVNVGDSPSRKMARALCVLLRVLYPSSCTVGAVEARVEERMEREAAQIVPLAHNPRRLDELLFDNHDFISSTRDAFSVVRARGQDVTEDAAANTGRDRRGDAGGASCARGLPAHDASRTQGVVCYPNFSPSLRQKIIAGTSRP